MVPAQRRGVAPRPGCTGDRLPFDRPRPAEPAYLQRAGDGRQADAVASAILGIRYLAAAGTADHKDGLDLSQNRRHFLSDSAEDAVVCIMHRDDMRFLSGRS